MISEIAKYSSLLPIPAGGSVSTWTQEWVKKLMPLFQGSVPADDIHALRHRNEELSAALPTFVIILACIRAQVIKSEREYIAANPKPTDKGIQAWTSEKNLHLADLENFYDFIKHLHESIETRLSGSQTAIRTISAEVNHGV